MQSTTVIKLDVALNGAPPTVFAKQLDKGSRYVSATLYDHGQALTIAPGVTARIRICKPDKTAVFNDATISSNVVTAELTQQTLAVPGTAVAEIGLYQGETVLSTFLFYVFIERSAVEDGAIESTDEFGALEEALAAADSAVSIATEAAGTANTAAQGADTAALSANTAAARAEAAASAVGDEIDGIVLIDEDTEDKYLLKFRIIGGAPYIDIYAI